MPKIVAFPTNRNDQIWVNADAVEVVSQVQPDMVHIRMMSGEVVTVAGLAKSVVTKLQVESK